MGLQFVAVASLDLCVAVHRRGEEGAPERVLHPVYRDKSVYYIRDRHCCVLCASDSYVYIILQDLAGDEKKTEGPAESSRGKEARLVEKIEF